MSSLCLLARLSVRRFAGYFSFKVRGLFWAVGASPYAPVLIFFLTVFSGGFCRCRRFAAGWLFLLSRFTGSSGLSRACSPLWLLGHLRLLPPPCSIRVALPVFSPLPLRLWLLCLSKLPAAPTFPHFWGGQFASTGLPQFLQSLALVFSLLLFFSLLLLQAACWYGLAASCSLHLPCTSLKLGPFPFAPPPPFPLSASFHW